MTQTCEADAACTGQQDEGLSMTQGHGSAQSHRDYSSDTAKTCAAVTTTTQLSAFIGPKSTLSISHIHED